MATSPGDPARPVPVWLVQCLRESMKFCSGYSKYLNVLRNNLRFFPFLFYLFFLDDLIHSRKPNYHLYANDYQIYISNPLLSLKFQIGTPNCLICIYFECLRYHKFNLSRIKLLICISLLPKTSSSPNFLQ